MTSNLGDATNSAYLDEAADDIPDHMSLSEMAGIISSEISRAAGYYDDELTGNRSDALDYYFGRPRGDERAGRSPIISMDVSDMIEASLSQIMPTFAQDMVVQFEAISEDDDSQAQLESDFVNHVVMEQNSGYTEFYSSVKDALLQRNGIIKVSMDEKAQVETADYEGLSELEAAMLAQPQQEGEQVIMRENGGITTVKRVNIKKRCKVSSVPPEEFLFATDTREMDLSDCRFCCQRINTTQSELIEMGYDPAVVADLPSKDNDTWIDSLARDQIDDESEHYTFQRSTRPIEIYEVYIRIDYDLDGISELRRIIYNHNGSVLEQQQVPFIPFAIGTPFLMPHRLVGRSLYDKIKYIQDSKTHTLRQYHDNMNANNNRRMGAVERDVNMQDILNSRPGGVVRMKTKDALFPIPVDDIGPSCMNLLGYMDKCRTESGGAALDMQTENLQINNQTAHGVERMMTASELLTGMMTKTLAETLVKNTYLLTHATMRTYYTEQMEAKLNGKWAQTNPSQWMPREKVNVKVGLSFGERQRQQTMLQTTIESQMESINQVGNGVLADIKGVYRALQDWMRLGGFSAPEQYWIDPDSEESQQAAQMNAQQQEMQQSDMAKFAEQQGQLEFYKTTTENMLKAQEIDQDYDKMLLDSEVEEAKIVGKATTDLELEQMRVRSKAGTASGPVTEQ
jgi:hypothetical protein